MNTNLASTDIMARLDEMAAKFNGTKVEVPIEDTKKAEQYRTAFWSHMHTGMPENALKEGSDGSGGYLVPDTYEKKLVKALTEKNFMRQIGNVIPTTHDLKIPLAYSTGTADWIQEGKQMTFMDAEFGQVKISAYKLGATVLASDELLEDAEIDLEEYVHSSMVETLGEREEEAFLVGDGKGKPTGIIYQAEVGTETEESGVITMDDAVDLTYSVKGPYRKNAVFVMSEEAYLSLRKCKHLNGRPAWSSNLADKEPETLFGFPVYVSKYLPDLTPGNTPILFGDFSYFWIGERGKRNMKRLSERFADRGMIGFVMSQRVDAKMVLPEAVKTLKVRET